MRITLASIRNILRVRDVEITPDSDRSVLLIGGANTQGKSSVLNALRFALGGKRELPSDPVRHGEESGEVRIEFDGGALKVQLRVTPDGQSKLEVRDANGIVKQPQTLLDKLVGARFLDPVTFLRLKPPEQRALLLKLIDSDGKLTALEERRERIFEKRTDVGREQKKAQGEMDRIGPVEEVAATLDVAALSSERARFSEEQRKSEAIGKDANQAEKQLGHAKAAADAARARIADLEKQLAHARENLAGHEATVDKLATDYAQVAVAAAAAAEAWSATTERRAQLDADLARANEHNRKIVESDVLNRRREEAAEVVRKLDAQYDQQTEMLAKIELQKLEFLKAASLPVPGLGVSMAGLTLNEVPFEQASGAEQLRVALGIAMASSPKLDDIWIRDGSLLDDDSLKLVEESAEAAGKTVWIERVGTGDADAIIIHDGMVVER